MNYMNNKDILLVAFNQLESQEKEKSFEGAVKLVKAIFMAQSESSQKNVDSEHCFHYSFYRWDYGPFDSKIYKDLAVLEAEGLIKIKYSGFEKCFILTQKGEEKALEFESDLKKIPTVIETIGSWMNKIKRMSKSEVLNLVYSSARVSEYEMGDLITLPKVVSSH